MRDQACQFFWIKNISQALKINKFSSSNELEEMAASENPISDYIVIPGDKAGSGQIELLVADPYEGFHLLT